MSKRGDQEEKFLSCRESNPGRPTSSSVTKL